MATFANSDYSTARYRDERPQYPSEFFELLRDYAEGPLKLTVDFACGTGQATIALARISEKVMGVDASAVMIKEANNVNHPQSVSFRVGKEADLLDMFEPNSVDMVTVAEAAHWLKYPEMFNSVHTILRAGGTFAIWAYAPVFTIVNHAQATALIQAQLRKDLVPLFESGVRLLFDYYKDIQYPEDLFYDCVRHVNKCAGDGVVRGLEMKRDMTVDQVFEFLKTYSGYHTWCAQHPGEPDVVVELKERVLALDGLAPSTVVTVAWDTVYLLGKAKKTSK